MSEKMPTEVFQQTQAQNLGSFSKELGLDIPVEEVALPSKGKLYSLDHPLANEQAVQIRCMTAREEDLLTSRALIKNGTVLSKLMEACVINKSINTEDLLVGDRNAILIAIRVTGYGENYDVTVSCPSCGANVENSFNLGKLAIKELGAEPVAPNSNLFGYTLPMTKWEVKFKLLTGKDQKMIDEEIEKKKKITTVDSGVTSRLFYAIQSINGDTDRNNIRRMVNNLPAGDARALRLYMQKIEPTVDMNQKMVCSQCNEESEVEIPMGITFFYPDASL